MRSLVLAVPAVISVAAPRAEAGAGAATAPASVQPIGVDRLMKEPEKYPGAVLVEGVVKSASQKQHLVTLIDLEEYRKCRAVTCSLASLPVRWTGEMPAVLDVVRVEGEVVAEAGKMVFAARRLERAPGAKP